ncbi:hypothetical protein SAY86_032249 [Trapa natans]|uniref:Xyloglucan endotransglucosylase/hydrolase n=1 Tax=Trapa natans TaxID=22666 RepID=A0AAN7R935_TRANT|nr:hypothetical protein SAY86_032249 [Trapa natans]
MALVFFTLILMAVPCTGQNPPSPGYNPSSRFNTVGFDQAFRNLWGPQHQRVDQDTLTIWLDRSSGSGFKSLSPYQFGYFSAAIKLQPGYTAGVITSFYLSNNEAHPGDHDEIDIEFLGTTLGKPYTLQTNVYMRGSGDGRVIGREMRFNLWFDPTEDFHNYAILWAPTEIMPMWVYGSIWDASSWATENGKYRADYQYQPFVGRYRNFRVSGCTANGSPGSCSPPSVSSSGAGGLSRQQAAAMAWVQQNHMVYNYCRDPSRDRTLTPECLARAL